MADEVTAAFGEDFRLFEGQGAESGDGGFAPLTMAVEDDRARGGGEEFGLDGVRSEGEQFLGEVEWRERGNDGRGDRRAMAAEKRHVSLPRVDGLQSARMVG